MYCPRCSQLQISDEIRFCSGCGFQLGAVKMLLVAETRNNLAMSENEPETQTVSTRKRDVLIGATVMLVAAVSVVLLMISSAAVTPWQAVVIPLLLVWTAMISVILLSGHAGREIRNLFSKDASASPLQVVSSLITRLNSTTARQETLPQAQCESFSDFGVRRFNTADLAQPLSITEHTTNSLNKKI